MLEPASPAFSLGGFVRIECERIHEEGTGAEVVAFVTSILILVVGVGIVFWFGGRRPPGTPVTWGEALVGGTFVFGLLLLAYGIVPNQWLKWADNELLWRPDRILLSISSNGVKFGSKAAQIGGRGRVLVNYQALRDILVAGIYGVMLGAHVMLWMKWQKRGRKLEAAAEIERTSAFGRPVVKKA